MKPIFPFLSGAKTPTWLALVLIYVRCAPRGFLKGLCQDSLVHNGNRTEWSVIRLLHEKFLLFDWLRAVVFQRNLKYLHVKITNLLLVVV